MSVPGECIRQVTASDDVAAAAAPLRCNEKNYLMRAFNICYDWIHADSRDRGKQISE